MNLLHQFDYTVYQWGVQTAISELAKEQAAANLGLTVPTFIQVETTPGTVGSTASSGMFDLAGMNPILIGGLVLGVGYMLLKGKKGGIIKGGTGGMML